MDNFMMKHTGWTIIIFMVLFIVAPAVAANRYVAYQCAQYGIVSGVATKYVNWDSCYVEHNGRYWRWEEHLKRSVAAEGLSE